MGNIWYLNVLCVMHGVALARLQSPESHLATVEQLMHAMLRVS